MKKILMIVASALVLAGCQPQTTSTTTPASDDSVVVTPDTAMGEEGLTDDEGVADTLSGVKTVNLDEQNKSGQPGVATLREVNGKVVVSLVMEGQNGVAQPAHIHVGACPKPGAVKWPLTDVVDGASETTLDIDMATLEAAGDLAVNVHKSAKELAVYTACGNIL